MGASVIYGAKKLGFNYLWRVDVAGERPPETNRACGRSTPYFLLRSRSNP
jgi:hypothetical protein